MLEHFFSGFTNAAPYVLFAFLAYIVFDAIRSFRRVQRKLSKNEESFIDIVSRDREIDAEITMHKKNASDNLKEAYELLIKLGEEQRDLQTKLIAALDIATRQHERIEQLEKENEELRNHGASHVQS